MTLFALFVGFLMLGISVLHPIVYKPIAKKYSADFSCFIIYAWIMAALLLTFPLMWGDFKAALPLLEAYPLAFLAALLKGVVAWYTIKFRQVVNKKSTSSVMFYPYISLALTALVVNVFFGENLNPIYLMSIMALGILGVLFCTFGDGGRLSLKWKMYMLWAILLSAACPTIDHIGISKIGWYMYLLISSVASFALSLFGGVTKKDVYLLFHSKEVSLAGFLNTLLEYIVIASSVSVLPVSISALFRRLAAPIVMVFSAVRYKEKTVRNQLIFGVLAILFALPIIFYR